jgi:hypothetical protein
MRLQYPKADPMNESAKLLNNSLYGKFGMTDEMIKIEIINIEGTNESQLNKILDSFNAQIKDITIFDNYVVIVHNKFTPSINNKQDLFFDDVIHQMDINIAIASAISAYSRIFMSQFKNNPNFKLYYSDTDSIFTDKPIPEHLIGSALGQLKLEHVITKAVFIAPKVYGFIDDKGNEIIKAKGLTSNTIVQLKVSDLQLLLKKDCFKPLFSFIGYYSSFKLKIDACFALIRAGG